jgi:hypothetical protein
VIWRRDKTTNLPGTPSTDDGTEGKGRPTPSRKQAEAERKERLKAASSGSARSRAAAAAAARSGTKSGSKQDVRKRIIAGDERVLAERDRGPERRLARDLVDARHTVGEYFLYLAIFVLILGLIQIGPIQIASQILLPVIVLALVVDSVRIYRGVPAAVREKYPNGNLDGIARYAMMRGLVTRRMRVPGPQVTRPKILGRS